MKHSENDLSCNCPMGRLERRFQIEIRHLEKKISNLEDRIKQLDIDKADVVLEDF